MNFAVGSLVRARGREWVVLPESSEDLLVLRPLGGSEDEVAGVYLPLEVVEPAHFSLPDPNLVGDFRSARLLRDALRLGFRSSAGPFRCLGRIAVDPRPYQLVPLLMALKLDPVRLLIADDVGVGKTIEACLVARELLDRGEITRFAVLCPPQLAEQWQRELREKFHIEAELVLPSTARRLERVCRHDQSLFDLYPFVIVSMDFIKADSRRDEFLRTCPELVIVDEAHTCAFPHVQSRGRHQRYQLVKGLAQSTSRHMLFVTATPHSGNEEAFRALLGLLDPKFEQLGEPDRADTQQRRRELARHVVQRRRADIEHFMGADTDFPRRDDPPPQSYKLSAEYRSLFERILAYARETVTDVTGAQHTHRVRWWSALALLRSLASSPAAAAATLRTRARVADAASVGEVDDVGRRAVLDVDPDDASDALDIVPGADIDESELPVGTGVRRRLLELARQAESVHGDKDSKVVKAAQLIGELLKDGFSPIVFCRFIPTAEYVAAQLRERLPKDVEIAAVTSTLPPEEREDRVRQLGASSERGHRVLVATDCLSEGINLQDWFDAVFHYDLAWNPTRHEQREGRVDRYGQGSNPVRAVTYYGVDNQIDGIVLDILIEKHKRIRTALGISVPVPIGTNEVIEAVFEGLLLREKVTGPTAALYLPGFEEFMKPKREDLFDKWEAAADREKRSRTIFAQESFKLDEIGRELDAVRAAIGTPSDVARFIEEAFRANGAAVTRRDGEIDVDLREVPRAMRELAGDRDRLRARFEKPVREGVVYLSRTHPIVEGLAAYLLDTSLDPSASGVARRAGAIRAAQVSKRTTLLLLRFRFHMRWREASEERELLAEDAGTLAFTGSPSDPAWLDADAIAALMASTPSGNVAPEQARDFVTQVVEQFKALQPRVESEARRRADELRDAHQRVRAAARLASASLRVEPELPADVLGIYVFLPGGESARAS